MQVRGFIIRIRVLCRVMAFQFLKAGLPRTPRTLSRPRKVVVKLIKPNDGKDGGSPPQNPSFQMSGDEKDPKNNNNILTFLKDEDWRRLFKGVVDNIIALAIILSGFAALC